MSDIALSEAIVEAFNSLGFTELTPIQAKALPLILSGKDCIAQAKTGSGKTAAYGLALLEQLDMSLTGTQGLVLVPTRELAEQVSEQLLKYARLMPNVKITPLYGGVGYSEQIKSLVHSPHIIVATPGRVLDHANHKRLDLANLKHFVLDEADRMLDMGFAQDLSDIIGFLPKQRQTHLFSATFPEKIQQLSQSMQRDAVMVEVDMTHVQGQIEQLGFECEDDQQLKVTAALLTEHQPDSAIVFCATKVLTQAVCDELCAMGFMAKALHGDLEQQARNDTLTCFANNSVNVLVATDVAARGLDIDAVGMVINYSIAHDNDTHTHRVGRTGRAGHKGLAFTLVSTSEKPRWYQLMAMTEQDIELKGSSHMRFHANRIVLPQWQTVLVQGGKKQKLRPGDIVGALTQDAGIDAQDIGPIKVGQQNSYVALKLRSVKRALSCFRESKIKGKRFRAKRLR